MLNNMTSDDNPTSNDAGEGSGSPQNGSGAGAVQSSPRNTAGNPKENPVAGENPVAPEAPRGLEAEAEATSIAANSDVNAEAGSDAGSLLALEDLPKRADKSARSERRRSVWRTVGEVAGVLGGAVIIALFLRAMVVQVYKIPSESMTETLSVGSRIAVNRVPIVGKQVHRGDVVVFRDTEGWLQPEEEIESHWYDRFGEVFGFAVPDGQQIVVKRVIGVGGDTIACCDANGRLMVNGVAVDEPYLAPGSEPSMTEFEIEVPEDSYWVMGDNRQNSADSSHHADIGDNPFIPASSIIGKAEYVIWPFGELSVLNARGSFGDVPDVE